MQTNGIIFVKAIANVIASLRGLTMMNDLPNGWFSPGDIDFYRYIYRELVPVGGKTAEIGCHRGRSICSVSDIIYDKRISVACIDMWEVWECSNPDDKESFFRNIAKFQIEDCIEAQITHSLDAAGLYGREFDFVFLDGDHSYENVKAEIRAWGSKIKPGGYLGGHDFNFYEGVNRAVLECYVNSEVRTRMDGNIWLVRLESARA